MQTAAFISLEVYSWRIGAERLTIGATALTATTTGGRSSCSSTHLVLAKVSLDVTSDHLVQD